MYNDRYVMGITTLFGKGGSCMKVNFFIDENQPEYIDFHVKKLTPAMQSMVDELQKQDVLLWGYQEKVVTPLKLDEIIRIKTESTEVHVQDISGTYKVKQRIYQLAELLPDNFIQISSGEIVNFDFIDHLKLSGNGNIILILNNGDETYVSRRYVSKIKRRLGI